MIGNCPKCGKGINGYIIASSLVETVKVESLLCPECQTIIGIIHDIDQLREMMDSAVMRGTITLDGKLNTLGRRIRRIRDQVEFGG